jgi:hypothetical protein
MYPRLLAGVALISCVAATNAQTVLPEDSEAFRAFMLERTALGSPIQSAKATAESLGLACTWVTAQRFSGLTEPVDYFYCSKMAGVPVAKRWQLALIPRGQELYDVRATFGYVGP